MTSQTAMDPTTSASTREVASGARRSPAQKDSSNRRRVLPYWGQLCVYRLGHVLAFRVLADTLWALHRVLGARACEFVIKFTAQLREAQVLLFTGVKRKIFQSSAIILMCAVAQHTLIHITHVYSRHGALHRVTGSYGQVQAKGILAPTEQNPMFQSTSITA